MARPGQVSNALDALFAATCMMPRVLLAENNMKRMPFTLLVLVVLLVPAVAQDAKKDREQLQGTWAPIKLIYNGEDLTNDNTVKFKLVFKGDHLTVKGTEEVEKEYAKLTFKLDTTAKPKLMDLAVKAGAQKDPVEAIYELKKDELKICAMVFGKGRPTEFASPAGTNFVLVVLKREPSGR
jgi:uncharacterized protein (TIGR03067 family)